MNLAHIKNNKDMAFLFKIQIKGITQPPVWRKVLVPEQFTFYKFHEVIQAAFGWQDSHLFQFGEKGYSSDFMIGIPDPEDHYEDIQDSKSTKLNKIFDRAGQKFTYIYDFGDDWVHSIVLEEITDSKILKANCLDGKGACPLEDCGGIYGYAALKEVMANPKDPEYESMKEWLGLEDDEVWDAKFFDLESVREDVRGI
jgi:hypothetical protein